MRILILYHNACADGSFAASIVSLAFPLDTVHYMALDYQQPNSDDIKTAAGVPLQEMEGIESYDRIYFVDFSVTERQLAQLTLIFGSNLYVFDHHDARTPELYKEECAKIPVPNDKGEAIFVQPSPNVTFASQHSGAMISYFGCISQFQPSDPRTMAMIGNLMKIVQLVSDRDTWQINNKRAFAFYDGYSREMFANKEETGVLYETLPSTIHHARQIILKGDVEALISLGFDRIAERNEHIDKLFAANGKIFEPNDIIPQRHAITSTARAIGSDAAQRIRDMHGVKLVLIVRCAPNGENPEDVYCSVRSDKDSPVTARDVANSFGGNGHATAAGCVIARKTFETFYPEINPDYKQVQI